MEDIKPLAPANFNVEPVDQEEARWELPTKIRNRRCIICCGCCTAVLVILGIVILVLALTVFRVRDPEMTMNSVKIDQLTFRLDTPPALNMTIMANISVKNPNAASFKFGNSTTFLSYRGTTVGEARIPAGKASARRTLHMNVTVDVLADKLLGVANLYSDIASGALPVSSYSKIGGRVNLLNIFKRHVTVMMNCTMTVSVSNQAIQDQKCNQRVKL
ncbi:late embryogenesis abundant protein At1g64065-like [Tasmannia lanceolata]|uniref:late embryogenesis abundant protein At1g64065-like n=1 Tax=Tasmannia lanceolata TaxID=3420 RepID=UPI004063C78D